MKFRKKLEKIFSNKVISYSVKNIFKFAKGKKTCWCNLESRRSTGSFLFQKKKKNSCITMFMILFPVPPNWRRFRPINCLVSDRLTSSSLLLSYKHSSLFFLSLDAEKLDVAGGTRKEKYSLSGKVLERRFYWVALTWFSRVFSAENPAPRVHSSLWRQDKSWRLTKGKCNTCPDLSPSFPTLFYMLLFPHFSL